MNEYSPIMEVAIQIVGLRDGVWVPSGTGVIIGKGLALTARHVVQDYLRRFEYESVFPAGGSTDVSFSIFGIQAHSPTNYRAYSVHKVYGHTTLTDIVILKFRVPDEDLVRWSNLRLDTLPPNPDSWVHGFGYHSSRVEGDDTRVEIYSVPAALSGSVVEVCHAARDGSMLNFPCYQIDARCDPGMSGGPVFDTEGNLRGILVSSLPAMSEREPHVTHVASLWPIFGIGIDVNRVGFPQGITYPALELARYGHLIVRNSDRLSLSYDENGVQVGLTLHDHLE